MKRRLEEIDKLVKELKNDFSAMLGVEESQGDQVQPQTLFVPMVQNKMEPINQAPSGMKRGTKEKMVEVLRDYTQGISKDEARSEFKKRWNDEITNAQVHSSLEYLYRMGKVVKVGNGKFQLK